MYASFKVELNQGQPQVEYKEAITRSASPKLTRSNRVDVVNLVISSLYNGAVAHEDGENGKFIVYSLSD
jgi:translation elongation factor EF-G